MKNLLYDRKIFLIIFLIISLFLFFIVLKVAKITSEKKLETVSREYHQIEIKNDLAKEGGGHTPGSTEQNVKTVREALKTIKDSATKKSSLINFSQSEVNSSFSRSEKLIDERKYKESLEETKIILEKINLAIEDYNKKYSEDIKQINEAIKPYLKTTYKVANYNIEPPWALASLIPSQKTPRDTAPDSGLVILKKEGDLWKRVLGPGTSIPKGELVKIGAPESLTKNVIVREEDELKYFVY